jgi:hypothetical protein
MHPSKAQHSTTQKPDSGLRLGFTDVQARGNNQPSGITQQSPSKTGISDSTFQFTFARPGPQLGPDAQRMMDELREEALRIKARLAAEREEEKRRQAETAAIETRQFAQPRGKVGRFSDVHMAEFKKMDSIAGHASAFRAQPGRFMPTTKSLKRTQSKAQLDDRDEVQRKKDGIVEKQNQSNRLENTAPAKRVRKHIADDASSARPVSRGDINKSLPATPTRLQPSTFTLLTTPTQNSLARSNVRKPISQIPMLARSPSKPNLKETPKRIPQPASIHNVSNTSKTQSEGFLKSPNKLDRVKSILGYSSSAKKQTSIPTLSRSPSKPSFEKSLPSVPITPRGIHTDKPINFTPEITNKEARVTQNSPSPMKSGIPRSTSKISFGVKATDQAIAAAKDIKPPVFSHSTITNKTSGEVEYPSLAGVRPLPEPPVRFGSQQQASSAPGTFTFRSHHTVSINKSPEHFGPSPGQSSVRQVRQSFISNRLPGAFPSNKENTPPLPSVPHGMSNKKRRRVESDDEDNVEYQHSPKKQKAAEGHMLMAPNLQKPIVTPGPKIASPAKKKGVLSLSRLNMLARPKIRR